MKDLKTVVSLVEFVKRNVGDKIPLEQRGVVFTFIYLLEKNGDGIEIFNAIMRYRDVMTSVYYDPDTNSLRFDTDSDEGFSMSYYYNRMDTIDKQKKRRESMDALLR